MAIKKDKKLNKSHLQPYQFFKQTCDADFIKSSGIKESELRNAGEKIFDAYFSKCEFASEVIHKIEMALETIDLRYIAIIIFRNLEWNDETQDELMELKKWFNDKYQPNDIPNDNKKVSLQLLPDLDKDSEKE